MKKWTKYQLENKHFTLPILSFPIIQKLGVTIQDFVTDSNLLAEGIETLSEYPVSACITAMDLSVEAEALGATAQYEKDEVPNIVGIKVQTEEDIDKLEKNPLQNSRMKIFTEAVEKATNLIQSKFIFGGMIGPYSLAGRLMGMTELMINCYEEPEFVHKLLNKCTQTLLDYLNEYKKSGADGVIIAEPAAGLLSPDFCEEFSSQYVRRLTAESSGSDFALVYHNCGNVLPLASTIASLGADAYHIGNAVDIEDMLQSMPKDKPVMGNINPILFKDGTPEDIRKHTLDLLTRCVKYDNFVISTGCDIPATAKWENIEEYFECVSGFYRK